MKYLWSYSLLVPLALVLGLAPFPFGPEPHLVEKSRMLMAGTLSRPIDILDMLWHAWPLVLLGVKAGRDLGARLIRNREES
jgi:hypothetical protein